MIQGVQLLGTNGCLVGDTRIDCPRDLMKYPTGIPIKSLVGHRFLTYSLDGNQMALRWADNVHAVGRQPVLRVRILSDNWKLGVGNWNKRSNL